MNNKLKDVKIGSKFSMHVFGTVTDFDILRNEYLLTNTKGEQFRATADIVANSFHFAHVFDTVKTVTQTEIIELFENTHNVAMTVSFIKKVNLDDNIKELNKKLLEDRNKNIGTVAGELITTIKDLFSGEERVMIGYHVNRKDTAGRVYFIDMEAVPNANTRLVDPRTIKYIIKDNVKYEVK